MAVKLTDHIERLLNCGRKMVSTRFFDIQAFLGENVIKYVVIRLTQHKNSGFTKTKLVGVYLLFIALSAVVLKG